MASFQRVLEHDSLSARPLGGPARFRNSALALPVMLVGGLLLSAGIAFVWVRLLLRMGNMLASVVTAPVGSSLVFQVFSLTYAGVVLVRMQSLMLGAIRYRKTLSALIEWAYVFRGNYSPPSNQASQTRALGIAAQTPNDNIYVHLLRLVIIFHNVSHPAGGGIQGFSRDDAPAIVEPRLQRSSFGTVRRRSARRDDDGDFDPTLHPARDELVGSANREWLGVRTKLDELTRIDSTNGRTVLDAAEKAELTAKADVLLAQVMEIDAANAAAIPRLVALIHPVLLLLFFLLLPAFLYGGYGSYTIAAFPFFVLLLLGPLIIVYAVGSPFTRGNRFFRDMRIWTWKDWAFDNITDAFASNPSLLKQRQGV